MMPIGIFDDSADVGATALPGSAHFSATENAYTLAGAGRNMWSSSDAFHYLWKQVSGDVALSATIRFIGAGKNAHRKACLIFRQNLSAASAYVDVALHGDGLTSLQFRHTEGGITQEVQANIIAPLRVRLEKRGDYILLFVGGENGGWTFTGAATRLPFVDPFYLGLAVCSHEEDTIEQAVFTDVTFESTPAPHHDSPVLYSTLETQVLSSTDRRVVYSAPTHFEAPNWLADGQTLLVNSKGRLQRIALSGGEPEWVDTGFAVRCNNDHGVSPDGTQIVISDQSQESGQSLIYTLPVAGGAPTRITSKGPSYWHGWSPDGKTLAFCGQRDGKYGIFVIPAEGGEETRLTTAEKLDDGPEYSPDGKYIYFNSDRTGIMQIWRIPADGGVAEQVTHDSYNNWFPHLSPDGRTMVYLSYEPDVAGHPPNKDVTLHRMTLATGAVSVLGRFFGGQGTINVPCWSPDGKRIAFVTYQLVA